MRSAWDAPNALVLGIEGAPPDDYNHRHLDSGRFILEAGGARWIVDCGTEHETYLSHQHSYGRWDFFRTRAEGHNTLVFNPDKGPDQVPKTPAPITRFESRPDRCTAEMDLSGGRPDSRPVIAAVATPTARSHRVRRAGRAAVMSGPERA